MVSQAGFAQVGDALVCYLITGSDHHVVSDSADVLSHVLDADDVLCIECQLDSLPILLSFNGVQIASRKLASLSHNRSGMCALETIVSPLFEDPVALLNTKECAILAYAKLDPHQYPFHSTAHSSTHALPKEEANMACTDLHDLSLPPSTKILFEAHQKFVLQHRSDPDLVYVARIFSQSFKPKVVTWKSILVCLLFVGCIALEASSQQKYFQDSIFATTVLLVGISVFLGILSWEQSLRAVRVNTIFIMAASFALGNAMTASGAAAVLANWMLSIFRLGGSYGIIVGLFLITALLTSILPNSAVATLMWPIAYQFSVSAHLPVMSTIVALMLSSSAAFSAPIGYQTNLMISSYYKFVDFIKFGLPLIILEAFIGSLFIWFIYF